MKKNFKKLLNITCLAVLIIFCYHNLSYAGNIGDSPEFKNILWALIYIPIILIILIGWILACTFTATTPRESSLKQQKYIDIGEKRDNKEKIFSIYEKILYTIAVFLILYLMLFYRNILLSMSIILAISFVLMIVFLYYIYIDKKQEKIEQERKTRKISKEKIEKNIIKIRNIVYLTNFLSTFIGLMANIGPISVLLLILILMSIIILMVSSKKIATIIEFFILISTISIILYYSIAI